MDRVRPTPARCSPPARWPHEDPAEDGTPVWGCTWGTQRSYADLRELDAAQFGEATTPESDTVLSPLTGIGDKAMLQKNKDDGADSYVYFATAGRYYAVQATVDRHAYLDGPNADREATEGRLLATVLAPRLSG